MNIEKEKYIKKIIKHQQIEEMRHDFCKKIKIEHGEELAWIYTLITLYLNDSVVENDENDEDSVHSKQSDILTHLKQFELALEWHDTPRINMWRDNIKALLTPHDRFIEYNEYNEYKKYKENEKNDENIYKDDMMTDIWKLLLSKKSKL